MELDSSGNPAVLLTVKDKDKFYEVTNKVKDYDQNMIVIWLDYNGMTDSYAKEGNLCGTSESNCLSAARVSQGFASDVIIQGDFTEDEVNNLVDLINSGSLPCWYCWCYTYWGIINCCISFCWYCFDYFNVIIYILSILNFLACRRCFNTSWNCSLSIRNWYVS